MIIQRATASGLKNKIKPDLVLRSYGLNNKLGHFIYKKDRLTEKRIRKHRSKKIVSF